VQAAQFAGNRLTVFGAHFYIWSLYSNSEIWCASVKLV